jgi:hypothetical protein
VGPRHLERHRERLILWKLNEHLHNDQSRGTNVSLSATPSFFLYQFNGWSGSSNSTLSTVQFELTTPLTYRAEFAFNYLILGVIAGAIFFLAAAAYVVSRRGRKISSGS